MKKKILCFIFAFIFIFPFAFTLAGCGEPPPETPPEQESPTPPPVDKDVQLTNFVNSLQNNPSEKDVTLTIDTLLGRNEYEIVNGEAGAFKTTEKTSQAVVKLDNGKYYALIPGVGEYYVYEQQSYYRTADASLQQFTGNYFNNKENMFDQVMKLANLATKYDSVTTLIDMAKFFNPDGVSLDETEEYYTLSIDFSFDELISNTIFNYLENKDKPTAYFISQFLTDFCNKTVDINELIDEFFADFTSQTTVKNLVDFIQSKTGLKIENFVKKIAQTQFDSSENTWSATEYNKFQMIDSSKLEVGKYKNNGKFSFVNFDYDTFTATTIASLFPQKEGKTAKQVVFGVVDSYLNNEEFTMENFVLSLLDEEQTNLYNEYLPKAETLFVDSFDINFMYTFNKSFKLVNLMGTFSGNIEVDYKAGLNTYAWFDLNPSDIGKTDTELPYGVKTNNMKVELYVTKEEVAVIGNNNLELSTANIMCPVADFTVLAKEYNEQTQQYSQTTSMVVSHANNKLILSNALINSVKQSGQNLIYFVTTEGGCTYEFVIYLM